MSIGLCGVLVVGLECGWSCGGDTSICLAEDTPICLRWLEISVVILVVMKSASVSESVT